MSATLPEYAPVPGDLELVYLQVVHRHGERTPVRSRLEKIIPSTWNLCDANRAMFATILDFNKSQGRSNDGIPASFVPLQRIVEKNGMSGNDQVTYPAGACYYGQLTNLGRKNMTSLGARLREIYIDKLHYLPDYFDEKQVYIRSSDYPRTQESVQQMVAGGLYPDGKRSDDSILQIRIRDPRTENLYSNPNCARLRELSKEFRTKVAELHKDDFKNLTKKLEKYVDDVSLVSHPSANGILDTVVSAKVHGFDLPVEFDDQVLLDLEKIVVHEWFYSHMESNEVRRLGLGRLMADIRDRMVRRANGTDHKVGEEEYKLSIYSGHDTTIAPILIILGGYDNRWPPFGSSIIFELFKKQGTTTSDGGMFGWFNKKNKEEDHFVRVRFNNKILQLPGCAEKGKHHSDSGDQSLCTLEAFKKIVQEQIPDDWTTECSKVEI
ncbi:histidine phosphatase superfamily [Halteromyces radiatus]|uniref:histidine phosphatase superfamily n=1 Tax=Halteromyces radiatus TaxID=101107 RepID=UPI00221E5256|nr:histidine phosphatase superfamily [Halteromyces radiatus]KAI8097301.1 histidine phosphatase superfamily [Halteromyces radiatus]